MRERESKISEIYSPVAVLPRSDAPQPVLQVCFIEAFLLAQWFPREDMLRGKATEESTFDTGRTVVGQP